MVKKIGDILLFLLAGIALAALLSFANKALILGPLYSPRNFKLDEHIQTLFCGASLAAFSFNPEVIPGSANVGFPAENFFYTYYKLNKIIQANPQINTVVLSYSFGSLSKKQDEDFIDPNKNLEYYNRYFMLLDNEGRRVIQRLDRNYFYALVRWHFGFPLELHRNLYLFYKAAVGRLQGTDFSCWGGFQEKNIEQQAFFKIFKQDTKKGISWALARHYPGDKNTFAASTTMIVYLKKITRLCKNKNIRMILIITPLQEDYFTQIPEYYKNLNVTTLKELKEINVDVEFYDYTQFLEQDKYFLDCDHLNRNGASIFSDMIYKELLFDTMQP